MGNASQQHDFSRAKHTVVVSDIHLTTAEPVSTRDPLWKRFKQRDFFIDNAFEVFLNKIQEKANQENPGEPIELILAGDIFDFDAVNQLPEKKRFRMNWLEKRRGLNTEERKSRYKIKLIIADHPVFFKTLRNFIRKGNRVVFIIGNHDLELHWPSVQHTILKSMQLTPNEESRVRFNNWFYISNKDTLVEHGNQHDSHSNCQNPINPKIQGPNRERIRLPFGCHANRNLMNGMGYFNPHSDRSYIMSTREYIAFFFKHLLKKEPFIMWTWFWGSSMTLLKTMQEGVLPEVKNPLQVEDQVEDIAIRANATPRMVRELKEVHAPPAVMDPLGVMRELWLDRLFLFALVIFLAVEAMLFFKVVWKTSYLPFVFALGFFMPFFIFYFRSVTSKVIVNVKYYEKAVKYGSKITKVNRVVLGHTHEFVHTNFDGIEYLNSGTWSPVFDDIECTKPTYPKTCVWIKPDPNKPNARIANVYEWKNNELTLLC